MKGWFMVEERGWKAADELNAWLSIGRDYGVTLPGKRAGVRLALQSENCGVVDRTYYHMFVMTQ
jgi:hypothetical protein